MTDDGGPITDDGRPKTEDRRPKIKEKKILYVGVGTGKNQQQGTSNQQQETCFLQSR
jgi:hypothetical protein